MNPGCILCVHGLFVPGPYPQQVKCVKLGLVTERKDCDLFEGAAIKKVNPYEPKKKTRRAPRI